MVSKAIISTESEKRILHFKQSVNLNFQSVNYKKRNILRNTIIAPTPCSMPVPAPWGIMGTLYSEHKATIFKISSTHSGYVTISAGEDLKKRNRETNLR